MTIRVDLANAAEISALFARAPDIMAEELETAVLEAELLALREIQERTPTAAGTLRNSWSHQPPARQGDTILGVVGTALAYAAPVELGSKPHMPPVKAIEDWVRIRFGLKGAAAKARAWQIAKAISRRGTKGHFMVRDTLAALDPAMPTIFQGAVDRAVARIEAGA